MQNEKLIIVFDLGNVLLSCDHMIACRRLSQLTGLSAVHIYDSIFRSGMERQFDEGRISSRHFLEAVRRQFALRLDVEQFWEVWNDIFAVIEPMPDLVRQLRRKGYQTVLLSNTNQVHFKYVSSKFDILKTFEMRVLSYEVGERKPNPAIYRAVLACTGESADRHLYFDDKPEFVAAAKQLGFKACEFTSPSRFVHDLAALGIDVG